MIEITNLTMNIISVSDVLGYHCKYAEWDKKYENPLGYIEFYIFRFALFLD